MSSLKEKTVRPVQQFFARHKQLFLTILYILGFVSAVIGSFQLLAPEISHPVMLIQGVFFAVIKLFLFQPAVSPGYPAPIFYQIATWLAPLSTVIGFLSIFETVLVKIRAFTNRRFSRQIVVVGLTPDAEIFMNNLKTSDEKSEEKRQITLLADMSLTSDERYRLEKAGFAVFTLDFGAGISDLAKHEIRRMKLKNAEAVVVFMDEPAGYGALFLVDEILHENDKAEEAPRPIPAYMYFQDEDLKEIIRSQMDELNWFDVHYFNLEQLMAIDLFQNREFTLTNTPSLLEPWEGKSFQTFEDFDDALGQVNLLLVGFEKLGQQVLRTAINQGVISTNNKMKVTIVDKNANRLYDSFAGSIRHIDKLIEPTILSGDLRARGLFSEVSNLNKENPYTAVIYTISDVQTSLLTLDKLASRIRQIDAAVYVAEGIKMEPVIDAIVTRLSSVTFFGEKREMLTQNIIMNDELNQRAMAFNASYNKTAAHILGWDQPTQSVEEQWGSLSSLKKDSSRAQSMHAPVKRALLAKLEKEGLIAEPYQSTLNEWEDAIDGKPIEEQISFFVSDIVRDYLTALEHRRWNTFYYLHDFTWGSQTNESAHVHDSLIDDWKEFMTSPVREKSIYDFLSVLAVKEQKDDIEK